MSDETISSEDVELTLAAGERFKPFVKMTVEKFIDAERAIGSAERITMLAVACEALLLAAHMAQAQTMDSFIEQARRAFVVAADNERNDNHA